MSERVLSPEGDFRYSIATMREEWRAGIEAAAQRKAGEAAEPGSALYWLRALVYAELIREKLEARR